MITIIKSHQLFSQAETETKWSKLIQFPLSRIVIAILVIAPIIAFRNAFSFIVLDNLEGVMCDIAKYTEVTVSIILFFIVYRFYTKKIEKRPAYELNRKKWLKELVQGIGIGGGLAILITLFLMVLGFYKIENLNSPDVLFSRIFRYGVGTFVEELLFTIIIFRLIEEFAGTIVSLVLVSLLFGFMHLGNDNATIFTSLLMALAHLLYLAPFVLTRRIWIIWGLHFGWNYFQTAVLGMNNSGMAHKGFVEPNISGPEWITGGSFGIEASYITIALHIIIGAVIMWYAIKQQQLVKASWKMD